MEWQVGLIALAAYAVGSFPTGVVISRRRFGIDVRDMGSGNIGATNITRNFGWKAGVITFLVDFMKGYLGLRIATALCPHFPWIETVAGSAVVLGHCFSLFLGLRGGKGVATTLGCLFAAAPLAGVLMAVCYLSLLAVTRVSAIGSLVGMGVAAVTVWIAEYSEDVRLMVSLCAAIVFVRHQRNIRRWLRF